MGETFEGAGLETGKRAGRELRELVTVLKHPLQVVPNMGQGRMEGLLSSALEKAEKER